MTFVIARGGVAGPAGHIGMPSMRERLQRAGGWLEIRSAPAPEAPVDVVTVLIAGDDVNYRLALAAVIDSEPSPDLVRVARSGAEAITLAFELEPDIVLADVRMGGGGGAGVARELSRADVRSRVIALSAYDDHPTVMQMFDAGAAAYLLQGSTVETLIEGISQAAQGLQAVGDGIAPVSRRGRIVARRTRRGRTAVVAEPTRVLLVDDNQDLLRELIAVVEADPKKFRQNGRSEDKQPEMASHRLLRALASAALERQGPSFPRGASG